jgi:hypothetical protein
MHACIMVHLHNIICIYEIVEEDCFDCCLVSSLVSFND